MLRSLIKKGGDCGGSLKNATVLKVVSRVDFVENASVWTARKQMFLKRSVKLKTQTFLYGSSAPSNKFRGKGTLFKTVTKSRESFENVNFCKRAEEEVALG